MPATMNASVTEGPARSAMAAAVRTKRPAPMIAPMPSATSDPAPSVRFSVASPPPATSAIRPSIDFVRNNAPATMSLSILRPRDYTGSLVSSEPFNIRPHARFGIAASEQVADHGDRRGAGVDHGGGPIERDAA